MDEDEDETECASQWENRRNLIGFWFLGLCNNFAYVIMLSAAHDILKEQKYGLHPDKTPEKYPDDSEYLQCNPIGTGAVLLADILPNLCIKLTSPFYIQRMSYRVKVSIVAWFAVASYLLVSLSTGIWMSITGVMCASISGGIGEVTFVSLTAFFDRSVISAWSSGTGGAGIFGALGYAGMTSAGISPRTTVLYMTVVPAIMAFNYFSVLVKPTIITSVSTVDTRPLLHSEDSGSGYLTVRKKISVIMSLFMQYMLPLSLVYFAEYFINQGLHELLYFSHVWLSRSEQYRWYQVLYQLGVFISRSSLRFVQIDKLWILPGLQLLNMVLLLLQVFFHYIPNIWIVFAIIVYEGLLGGASYVNTFYKLSKEVSPETREFSLGVTTIAESVGTSIAGAVSVPTHNHICSLHLKF